METSGSYLYVQFFFSADFSVTSGSSHLSFLPVASVSADETLSALAARLFTLFLILNLIHSVSLSHQLAAIPENLLFSILPRFLPSLLPCPSLTSPLCAPPPLWLSCHNLFSLKHPHRPRSKSASSLAAAPAVVGPLTWVKQEFSSFPQLKTFSQAAKTSSIIV